MSSLTETACYLLSYEYVQYLKYILTYFFETIINTTFMETIDRTKELLAF